MEQQVVVFLLNGQYFGVSIQVVESIIKMQPVTALPQAPSFVQGVIDLRGKVLPVVDLHRQFGLPRQAGGGDSRIIVVNNEGCPVGMQVDSVSEVLTLSSDCIELPPSMAMTVRSEFITGIARLDDRLVILLDLRRVLSTEEQQEMLDVL